LRDGAAVQIVGSVLEPAVIPMTVGTNDAGIRRTMGVAASAAAPN